MMTYQQKLEALKKHIEDTFHYHYIKLGKKPKSKIKGKLTSS